MGHRCCSKQKVKRGLWSPEEDEKLLNFITSNGHSSWSSVPKHAGLQRCGKSCRLRWINYLRPDLKRGSFTEEEEITIIEVHRILGNRWAQIAKHLPGRTDNEVKNFWNSCIKKKLLSQGLDPNTHNLLPPPRKHYSASTITNFTIQAGNNTNNSTSPNKKQPADTSPDHQVFTVNTIRPHKKDSTTSNAPNLSMLSSYLPPDQTDTMNRSDPPSTTLIGWTSTVMEDSTSVNGCLDNLPHGFGLMDEDSMWVDSGLEKTAQFDDHQHHVNGEVQMSCNADQMKLKEINAAMEEADEVQLFKRLQMGGEGLDHLPPFSSNDGFDFGFGEYDTILQSGMYGDVVSSMDQVAWDIAN